MTIHIINGPNLNLVGKREPEVYGNRSLDQYLQELIEQFPHHSIDVYQSNIEGEIVDRLQAVGFEDCGIVLTPGATPTRRWPSPMPWQPARLLWSRFTSATSTAANLSATSLYCLLSARASLPASASTATA